MIDERGNRITNNAILEQVLAIGAIVIEREPVESADFYTWRGQLRRAGKNRGIRIGTNRIGGRVLVHNPDHVVTDAQRRAVITAVADVAEPDRDRQPTRPAHTGRPPITTDPDPVS